MTKEKKDYSKYIFGIPDYVQGVGYIYPVKLKDYYNFMEWQYFLNISKNHLEMNKDKLNLKDGKEVRLLDFVLINFLNEEDRTTINNMEKLFSLVLKEDVFLDINEKSYRFSIKDSDNFIDRNNYDEVRKTIMRQNLLFEPKVFENKMVQEWAEKIIKTKQKNGVKMTFEDMITTISCFKGLKYEDMLEQTIYAINADFNRIAKMKDYDTSVSFKCAGAEKVKIPHFAEELYMFKNPYDDLFVEKGKLKNINKAVGES